MKTKMEEGAIPTPGFRVFDSPESLKLEGMNYPVVMKPVDSQGQRGIFVLNGREDTRELEQMFRAAQQHSMSGTVIFEEFYPGQEITVNTWVKEGQAYNLLITDRLHFDDRVALGVCKQQRYPAKAAEGWESEINFLVQRLVTIFQINDGPLYIQMVIGNKGPQFIEFGYRIGGGFESEIIPRVTGIDILDLYITLVTEGRNNFEPGQLQKKASIGSIFFLFANPGKVNRIVLPGEFSDYHGRIFIREGEELGAIENATSRIGCFAFYSNDPNEYYRIASKFDSEIAVFNGEDKDILIHRIWE